MVLMASHRLSLYCNALAGFSGRITGLIFDRILKLLDSTE